MSFIHASWSLEQARCCRWPQLRWTGAICHQPVAALVLLMTGAQRHCAVCHRSGSGTVLVQNSVKVIRIQMHSEQKLH